MGPGPDARSPLTAKIISVAIASCLTYLGNRLWTFGDRPRPDTTRSIMMFILVNVIAAALQLSCLAFSRYVLGLDSVLADNISGTSSARSFRPPSGTSPTAASSSRR